MSSLALEPSPRSAPRRAGSPLVLPVEALGELTPLGRPGGQGRVYRPAQVPPALGALPIAAKLYRRLPSPDAAELLGEMIVWSEHLDPAQRARLYGVTAWPVALLDRAGLVAGIAMPDLSQRFEVPFVMPSGRQDWVLLSLEHLLGRDDYLQARGLGVLLDTRMRIAVAEQVSGALAFLHRHGIVASDIAPNNLLVGFRGGAPSVSFIDCDSMVFHGRQALPQVETGDWQIPREFSEPPRTRAADAYKLGLVILRLLARSHDARNLAPHVGHVPVELRRPLARALASHPANRPPAGEWQRALRQSLLDADLSRVYPGPVPPRPRPRPAPASPRRVRETAPRPTPAGTARPALPPRQRPRRPISLAWTVLVAVIFVIILLRLMSGLAASAGGQGFGPSAAGGSAGQGGAPYQYYYAPSSPGGGSP
jgi:hypothetical protein